jgi:hypothetical protein
VLEELGDARPVIDKTQTAWDEEIAKKETDSAA